MNIHQLLSASPSSPQTQSQGAFSRQDSPNGFFQQALLQAADKQGSPQPTLNESGVSPASTHQPPFDALSSLLSEALAGDVENLNASLEALGLDVSESDLSQLLTQLQLPESNISVETLGLNEARPATQLDEIVARLALIASFSEGNAQGQAKSPLDPAVLESIAEDLNITSMGSEQPAGTVPLEVAAEHLTTNQLQTASPIGKAALETIAEQLNIDQTEAAQLVSALNGLVNQQQGTQLQGPQLSQAEMASITNAMSRPGEPSLASRTDALLAQPPTAVASPQISSEALMGALLTSEGSPKGGQASEHLLTGFSLSAHSGQFASAQPQGATPAATPTPATLSTPFTSPAWPQQLSQQLVQFSQRGGEQHVQMQLNPAELGPLSISLKFGEQGAQAHFLSAHAQVRQVLEQAIPQLREALAEQGISLGETSVGEQRDPNAQAFAQSNGRQGGEGGSDSVDTIIGADEIPTLSGQSSPLILDGRVDLYA